MQPPQTCWEAAPPEASKARRKMNPSVELSSIDLVFGGRFNSRRLRPPLFQGGGGVQLVKAWIPACVAGMLLQGEWAQSGERWKVLTSK